MPCDTVNTLTIDFNKSAPTAIKAAVSKLYPNAIYLVDNGKLILSGINESKNDVTVAVRREMSRQTVMAQAKRFGWAVKEQPDGKLLIQKAKL